MTKMHELHESHFDNVVAVVPCIYCPAYYKMTLLFDTYLQIEIGVQAKYHSHYANDYTFQVIFQIVHHFRHLYHFLSTVQLLVNVERTLASQALLQEQPEHNL